MSPPVSDFIATQARLGAHNYDPLGVILSRGEGAFGCGILKATVISIASPPTRR